MLGEVTLADFTLEELLAEVNSRKGAEVKRLVDNINDAIQKLKALGMHIEVYDGDYILTGVTIDREDEPKLLEVETECK